MNGKKSDEIIYNLVRRALDYEWDVFKSYDSKASTILVASGTILSIFIAIQFYGFDILKIFDIEWNFELGEYYTSLLYLGLCFASVVLFAIVVTYFLLSIWKALKALRMVNFLQSPDPVELIYHQKDKSEENTRIQMIKIMAYSWRKNHNEVNLTKAKNISKSFYYLTKGIILLAISLVFSGITLYFT